MVVELENDDADIVVPAVGHFELLVSARWCGPDTNELVADYSYCRPSAIQSLPGQLPSADTRLLCALDPMQLGCKMGLSAVFRRAGADMAGRWCARGS